jgi:hypothetical protein
MKKIKINLYHNFITYNYLITSLKSGRRAGSLSQHFFINFTQLYGIFFGIGGRSSLLSTSSETLLPEIFLYGG